MGPVHLCVVELKGYGQIFFEKTLSVFSPNQERIVENSAVHPHCAINIIIHQRRGTDDHALCQVMVSATVGHLPGQPHVITMEQRQLFRKRDVAGTYFSIPVGYDCIHGDAVILHQLVADGKKVELLDGGCGFADAPAHQHIELQAFLLAFLCQAGYVQCLEKGDHGHGGLHPHIKCVGTCSCCRIDFFHHMVSV